MERTKSIDPRVKLILVPMFGFISFLIQYTVLLIPLLLFICILYISSGMYKKSLNILIMFSLVFILEKVFILIHNANVLYAIYIVIYIMSRMIVIGSFGVYLTKTTKISEIVGALEILKIPKCISVPFSVFLRFAPTMKHEIRMLRENIMVRGIVNKNFYIIRHPFKYIEFILVPLLMRAITISDELSASAMIRGLENDEKRILMCELSINLRDILFLCFGVIIIIITVILQNIIF